MKDTGRCDYGLESDRVIMRFNDKGDICTISKNTITGRCVVENMIKWCFAELARTVFK